MGKLIEYEALLKDIDELKKSPWYNDDYGFGTKQARHDGVNCVVDLCIKQAPAVNAIEVVRCKDCKHFCPYEGEEHKGDCEELVGLESCVYEDDFCSYGEKKID